MAVQSFIGGKQPHYGSLVLDLNAWDRNDPHSYAEILPPSSSRVASSSIGFFNELEKLDRTIVNYIDSYKNILDREMIGTFGPKFADQVEKARFTSQAEFQAYTASFDRPDAAYTYNGVYVGKVARNGEYDIDIRIGVTQTVNCNKVDLSRVPEVGEDVLIRYNEGKGKVDSVRRIQPHNSLHRSYVGDVVALGQGVLVQDIGRNTLVTHETKHLQDEISIGKKIRIAYDGRGRPSVEQRSRAEAELSR